MCLLGKEWCSLHDPLPGNDLWRPLPPLQTRRLRAGETRIWHGDVRQQTFRCYDTARSHAPTDRPAVGVQVRGADVAARVSGRKPDPASFRDRGTGYVEPKVSNFRRTSPAMKARRLDGFMLTSVFCIYVYTSFCQ